jgi:hypothetical protein
VPFPLEALFSSEAVASVGMPDAELEWSRGQLRT